MYPWTCSLYFNDYGQTYCQWSYYPDDEEYDWGCGSGLFCEAFADGYCGYYDTDIPYTGCDGNTKTESMQQYFQCCNGGNNCNAGISNVDLDKCVRATAYEKMYNDYYDCIYKSESAYFTYVCDDDVDEITCDGLTELYNQDAECKCKFYEVYYDQVSSATQVLLQKEVDKIMAEYSEWNDIFGCDINLLCDLSTDGDGITTTLVDDSNEENDSAAAGKLYSFALLWSNIVYFVYCY